MNPLKLNLSSLLGGIAFVFLASVSSLANADGLLARGSDLGAADRAKLASLVARQRRTDPASFAAVRDLQGIRPEVYRERRNPIPEVGRELQHMGGKALLPVLEALVLDAPRVDGLSTEERQALVEGMLSAVARLRDARASAPMRAAFVTTQPEWASRGIATALGKLCDAASFERLTGSLRDGARRGAAIDGLGECRTVDAARTLSAELARATSAEESAAIARALGNLGASWAWRALGASRQAEGKEARAIIATALVRSYPETRGESRVRHRAALAMLDASGLRVAVDANRPSDASLARELDELVRVAEKRRAR
ncbi:MAG: hypothetical protein FJ096_17440 [Deltaproteobacteria bacterium]|nr:hypothetical protein [Deltaproteobacteria bacterium]